MTAIAMVGNRNLKSKYSLTHQNQYYIFTMRCAALIDTIKVKD